MGASTASATGAVARKVWVTRPVAASKSRAVPSRRVVSTVLKVEAVKDLGRTKGSATSDSTKGSALEFRGFRREA